jgi:hypothetical protein
MLKQRINAWDSSSRANSDTAIKRKEVTKMADKKSDCGCGCIPLKEIKNKPTKEKKNPKKAK